MRYDNCGLSARSPTQHEVGLFESAYLPALSLKRKSVRGTEQCLEVEDSRSTGERAAIASEMRANVHARSPEQCPVLGLPSSRFRVFRRPSECSVSQASIVGLFLEAAQ